MNLNTFEMQTGIYFIKIEGNDGEQKMLKLIKN